MIDTWKEDYFVPSRDLTVAGTLSNHYFLQQADRRDSDYYARQLDYALMRSLEEIDTDDMANTLLSLNMAMDSWLTQAILSSIFWNSKPKKAASRGSTQTAIQAEVSTVTHLV